MDKGKILQEYIRQSDFTQKQIAQKLGMRDNYFSTLLKKKKLSEDFIQKVCEILNVSPESVFSATNSDYQSKYEVLQEKYFEEKTQLLNQVQQLMEENHALKEANLKLIKKFGK